MAPPLSTDLDLIIYDFDGVMTDNRVYVNQDGTELVACNRADGLGVNIIRGLGVRQIIISTETNRVVQARADKLRLEVMHGVEHKQIVVNDYCRQHKLSLQRTLYVGNDVNDLEAMRLVRYPVCPSDAHPTIRQLACFVLNSGGGQGVVRELADLLTPAS
jgi:3-deoxy-D-manno-octulosonate 8-phosphate phosphatase (KDO 8-P phosphatase)